MTVSTHKNFLQMAVDESKLSIENGSSPFGAVIVKNGQVIAKAHNTVVPDCDATAHAEVNAIRLAGKALGTFDLTGAVLYSSCEPCPMCLNAIKWANIQHVYFAATRDNADAIGFRDRVFYEEDNIELTQIAMPMAAQVMQDWYLSKDKKAY